MIKTAVILAAGLGSRFGEMTESMPKGFIEVSGKAMVIRSIETLIECGIQRIIIGTGYKKEMYEQIMNNYPQIECCFSPKYAETNSMWTLYACRELIGSDDFLLLESDIIFEKRAICDLLSDRRGDIMLISDLLKFQDQYFVEHNDNEELTMCSINNEELNVCGELVGIHKISSTYFELIKNYYLSIMTEKPKMGYEYALLEISQNVKPLYTLNIKNLQWYEIDDEIDLKYAEENIAIHI